MIFNLFKAMPPRAAAFASMKRPAQVRFMATVRQRAAMEPATFTIRDGPMFSGKSFGARSNISGEAVFTTSLVGYPESLTDPSYRGQILVFTQPLIGNYGVPSAEKDTNGLLKYFESPNLQAAGVVVADLRHVARVGRRALPGRSLVAHAGLNLASVVAVAVLVDVGRVADAADAVALGLNGRVQVTFLLNGSALVVAVLGLGGFVGVAQLRN